MFRRKKSFRGKKRDEINKTPTTEHLVSSHSQNVERIQNQEEEIRRLRRDLEFEKAQNRCDSVFLQRNPEQTELANLRQQNQLLRQNERELQNKVSEASCQITGLTQALAQNRGCDESNQAMRNQIKDIYELLTKTAGITGIAQKQEVEPLEDIAQNAAGGELASEIPRWRYQSVSSTPASTISRSYCKTECNQLDQEYETAQEKLLQVKQLLDDFFGHTDNRFDTVEALLVQEMDAHMKLQEKLEERVFAKVPDKPDVVTMPQEIKAFGKQLMDKMARVDHVKKLGRALGLEQLELDDMDSPQVTHEDLFWTVLSRWWSRNKDKSTLYELQDICNQAGISLSGGLMPKIHRQAVEKSYPRLESDLFPILTLPFLREKNVLDTSDIQFIMSQSPRPQQCASLINILPLFGENAFEIFCEALEKSGQCHITDCLNENVRILYGVTGGSQYHANTERNVHENCPTLRPPSRGDRLPDNVLSQILATLIAKTSNIEGMLMHNQSLSSGYNSFSSARSTLKADGPDVTSV